MNIRFGVNVLKRKYLLLSLTFFTFSFSVVKFDSAYALTNEEKSKFMTYIDKSVADSSDRLVLEDFYPFFERYSSMDPNVLSRANLLLNNKLSSKLNSFKDQDYRNAMEYIPQMLIKNKNFDADFKELESLFLDVYIQKIFKSISQKYFKKLLESNAELKASPEENEFIKNFRSTNSEFSDDELIKSIIELRKKNFLQSLGRTVDKFYIRLEKLYPQVYFENENIKTRRGEALDFMAMRKDSLEMISNGIKKGTNTLKIRDGILRDLMNEKIDDNLKILTKRREELLERIRERLKNEVSSLLFSKTHPDHTLDQDEDFKDLSKKMMHISDEEHGRFMKDIGPLLKDFERINENVHDERFTAITSAPDPIQLLQIIDKASYEGLAKLGNNFMSTRQMEYSENLLSTGDKLDRVKLEKDFDQNFQKDTQAVLALLAQGQNKYFRFAKHFASSYAPDSSEAESFLSGIKSSQDKFIDQMKNRIPSLNKVQFDKFLSNNDVFASNAGTSFKSKVLLQKMKEIEDKYKSKIDSIMDSYYGVGRKKGLNLFQKRSLANELKTLTQMRAKEESAQISKHKDVSNHFDTLSKEYVRQNNKNYTPEERKKYLDANLEFDKKYGGEYMNNKINQQKRPQRLMQQIKNESEMNKSGCGPGNSDINLRDKGFSMEYVPEQDQQNLGTCYANASVQAFQALLQSTGQAKKEGINLSTYITALESGNGGNGGQEEKVMDLLLKVGACKYEHFEGPIREALEKLKGLKRIGDFDSKIEEIYKKHYKHQLSTWHLFKRKVENKSKITDEFKVELCSYLTSISTPKVLADYVMEAVAKMPESVNQSNPFKFNLFNCPQNERITMDNSFKEKVKLKSVSKLEPYLSIKNRQKIKNDIDLF